MSEKLTNSSEHRAELVAEQQEQKERLRSELERAAERGHENQERKAESARHEIERATAEKEQAKQEKVAEKPASPERQLNTKAARKKAFNDIMDQTQSELSAPSRAFSKVIHNPAVEKASEALGATVARPNAILSGASFSFLFTLAIYLIARMNGYPLSGSETIAAFVGGWGLGLIFDFFKVMITGRR